MPPQSPPSEKGPKKSNTHTPIPYKPLTSSPLNPFIISDSHGNGPSSIQHLPPPRPRFKLNRAASPRKWLLRQKATAAMRASELRRGLFSTNDMTALMRSGRSDSEPGSESRHQYGHELGRFGDGEDGDIGLCGAGAGVDVDGSRLLKPLPTSIPGRPRTPLGPETPKVRYLPRNGDGNRDFELAHVVGVGPARGFATRQLLMTTEAGTVTAFPVRHRPRHLAISPVLFLLGLACVVGLVPCLLRGFTPSSGTIA